MKCNQPASFILTYTKISGTAVLHTAAPSHCHCLLMMPVEWLHWFNLAKWSDVSSLQQNFCQVFSHRVRTRGGKSTRICHSSRSIDICVKKAQLKYWLNFFIQVKNITWNAFKIDLNYKSKQEPTKNRHQQSCSY